MCYLNLCAKTTLVTKKINEGAFIENSCTKHPIIFCTCAFSYKIAFTVSSTDRYTVIHFLSLNIRYPKLKRVNAVMQWQYTVNPH